MTLQLDFDKYNQANLLSLLKWLKEIGPINSYKILEEELIEENKFELTDEEFQSTLKASAEVKNGKYISHEEVVKSFKS